MERRKESLIAVMQLVNQKNMTGKTGNIKIIYAT